MCGWCWGLFDIELVNVMGVKMCITTGMYDILLAWAVDTA
jgi:hypothetical protein